MDDGLGPGSGVVPTGTAWCPKVSLLACPSAEVIGGEGIEAASGNSELAGGFDARQSSLSKPIQNVADEGMGVAMEQLLVLFKSVSSTRAAPTASHFVGLRYAPASSMAGRGGSPAHPKQKPICPALLTTESVQVCSPRDTS